MGRISITSGIGKKSRDVGKYHLRDSNFFVLGTALRPENTQIIFDNLEKLDRRDKDDNWHPGHTLQLTEKDKAKFGLQEAGSLVHGSFVWSDQGWGYNKGGFRVTRNGDNVFGVNGAPRPEGKAEFSFTRGCDDTDKLQTFYSCGGGGGH
jgi:hypothetical protein